VAKKKGSREQKQGPPVQFRPGVELAQMLAAFAGQHNLSLNDGCKVLVALAAAEMDSRFYPLVKLMSQAMGGLNAYTRSCEHIHIALEAGRRVTGLPLQLDPGRSWLILQTVRDYIAGKGLPTEGVCLWFLPEEGVGAASQEAQQAVPNPFEQPKSQPAQPSGFKKPRRVARATTRQRPTENAEGQEEASEGAQGVPGGQVSQPDPAT
jgi:hypothetical protein